MKTPATTPTLAQIQAAVRAPKDLVNKFAGYKYRSKEGILEAVKPVINPLGFYVVVQDEIIEVGGRIYVKATAILSNGDTVYTATAFARESESRKGMDEPQLTGTASSYAGKYALSNLFGLDDVADSDAVNTHGKGEPATPAPAPVPAPPADLMDKIKSATTVDELKTLYNDHKENVNADPKLLRALSERKKQITPPNE
jgi:hypothetical protein